MQDMYFNRVRRILTCHVEAIDPVQAKELVNLIQSKVKKSDAKAETQPRSSGGNTGASA
jgi:hypothetical protein